MSPPFLLLAEPIVFGRLLPSFRLVYLRQRIENRPIFPFALSLGLLFRSVLLLLRLAFFNMFGLFSYLAPAESLLQCPCRVSLSAVYPRDRSALNAKRNYGGAGSRTSSPSCPEQIETPRACRDMG